MKNRFIKSAFTLLFALTVALAPALATGCSWSASTGSGTVIANAGAYAAGQVLAASLKDPAKTEAAIVAREAVKYLDGQPVDLTAVAVNELLGTLLRDKLNPNTYALVKAGAGILDSLLPPPSALGTSEGAVLARKIIRQFLDGIATGGGRGLRGHVSKTPGHWLNK